MSAVISLHQVFDPCGSQRRTVQSQSDTKTSLLKTVYYAHAHRSVFTHVFTLHVLSSNSCCIADIILQDLVSFLYWAWLVRVFSGLIPACLSVCPSSACCLCCPQMLSRLLLEPQHRTHDNKSLSQVCKLMSLHSGWMQYEYGSDHVGDTRRSANNDSRLLLLITSNALKLRQ